MLHPPQNGLLLAYYGDDFTGSTDVMEALQWAGLRTVLFLDPPSQAQLGQFENLRAFGIAGASRTMSPTEMETALKPAFLTLRESGAPLVHYKICSTFDSSPDIGSIGKALDIGREVFGPAHVPILVGAPVLGRFTVFGNLFARSGLDTEPFRLDRHPTMRQHPITPMNESDIRVHLKSQTDATIELMDVLRLEDEDSNERFRDLLKRKPRAILFDVLYPSHLQVIGRLIEEMADSARPLFCVGSSGVEYALTAHWKVEQSNKPRFAPVDQLVIITGSCSPVNDQQIGRALADGFVEVPLDPVRLVRQETSEQEIHASVTRALEWLDKGANVILHSSRGPSDPRVAQTKQHFAESGFTDLDVKLKSGSMLGPKLGQVLKRILARKRLARAGVTGGDTSGFVARELGIEALEAIAPVAPGSPLCRVHSQNALNGLEIIFKGGQVGHSDVYGTLLKGNY